MKKRFMWNRDFIARKTLLFMLSCLLCSNAATVQAESNYSVYFDKELKIKDTKSSLYKLEQSYTDCRINNKIEKDEYETRSQFEKRASKLRSNCNNFIEQDNVEFSYPVKLKYNSEKEEFTFKIEPSYERHYSRGIRVGKLQGLIRTRIDFDSHHDIKNQYLNKNYFSNLTLKGGSGEVKVTVKSKLSNARMLKSIEENIILKFSTSTDYTIDSKKYYGVPANYCGNKEFWNKKRGNKNLITDDLYCINTHIKLTKKKLTLIDELSNKVLFNIIL